MAAPLYITEISRKNGIVYATVLGSSGGISVGQMIQILGVSDPSFNVTAKVSRVQGDTVCYAQRNLFDVTGLKGGALSIGS